jgi:hypothetical protein
MGPRSLHREFRKTAEPPFQVLVYQVFPWARLFANAYYVIHGRRLIYWARTPTPLRGIIQDFLESMGWRKAGINPYGDGRKAGNQGRSKINDHFHTSFIHLAYD